MSRTPATTAALTTTNTTTTTTNIMESNYRSSLQTEFFDDDSEASLEQDVAQEMALQVGSRHSSSIAVTPSEFEYDSLNFYSDYDFEAELQAMVDQDALVNMSSMGNNRRSARSASTRRLETISEDSNARNVRSARAA